ncbi:unnamed protein product, partial [Effrenium voratum]
PLQLRLLSVRLKFACLGLCDSHGGIVHVAVAATCSSGHGVPQFVSPFFGHFSKAMDLRRKIDQMACLESDGEQEKVKKMGVAKCAHIWRRLVLALSTMLVTARQQAVVDYLAKRAHQNDENEEHSKNKSQRSQAPEAPQAKKLLLEKGVEYPQFLPAPRSRPEQGDLEVIVNRMGKPVVSTHKKHDNCQKDNSDLKTAGPIKEPMHAGIQVKQEKNDEDKKAQKLYAKISRLGYALTTVMIYLSTTSRTMESIPDYLIGNMVQVYGWQSKEGLWDTISIHPEPNEHYQHVDEWCYVFHQPEHMHSWVTDQDGEVIKLDRKEQHYLPNRIKMFGEKKQKDKLMRDLAVRIAWIQISGGRGFLFEHPLRAKSWTTTSLEELKERPEVKAVTLDMCRFGLQTMPAKKPTLIITNIPEIASALNRRCQGHHEEHQLLVGDRRANNAAVYPQPFVDEILKALRKHIRASHFPVVELKDRWEVRHNQLICRHFQPWQQLCTLEECEEFDFPVEKFTGKRTTTKTYEDGSTKQSVDDWRFHTSTTTSSAAQRWTGTTAFDLIIEVMLPAEYQNRATWMSAAAAHPIQEYVTAEGAFHQS